MHCWAGRDAVGAEERVRSGRRKRALGRGCSRLDRKGSLVVLAECTTALHCSVAAFTRLQGSAELRRAPGQSSSSRLRGKPEVASFVCPLFHTSLSLPLISYSFVYFSSAYSSTLPAYSTTYSLFSQPLSTPSISPPWSAIQVSKQSRGQQVALPPCKSINFNDSATVCVLGRVRVQRTRLEHPNRRSLAGQQARSRVQGTLRRDTSRAVACYCCCWICCTA